MADLESRLARARADVFVPWSTADAAAARRGMRVRRARRTAMRAAAVGLTALLAAVAITRARAPVAPSNLATAPAVLRDDDGSTATALSGETRLRWAERTPGRAVVQLLAGAARFEVTHAATRVYRVEAGSVAVQVLGTAFTVARAGAGADVAVRSGRVRVFWGDGRHADLGAGEHDVFPRDVTASNPAVHLPVAPTAEQPDAQQPAAGTPEAPATVDRAPRPRGAGADPYESAMAALAARDYAQAAARLQAVAARGARDPNAGLAAFRLGRLYQEHLGRPREAGEAFARAHALGMPARETLPREADCRAQAGDLAGARAAARAYLADHPSGESRERMQRIAGTAE